MAKVILSPDLRPLAGGAVEVTVSAVNYRDLVAELSKRFPDMHEAIIRKQALAINGVLYTTPLLERFASDGELVFVARFAGG